LFKKIPQSFPPLPALRFTERQQQPNPRRQELIKRMNHFHDEDPDKVKSNQIIFIRMGTDRPKYKQNKNKNKTKQNNKHNKSISLRI
jgi:hypothetical protein